MLYNEDTLAIELTVEELCAYAHKAGSLDTRFPRRPERPAVGATCVPLCNTTTYHGITYTVEGFADRIEEENGSFTVEVRKAAKRGRFVSEDTYARLRCLGYFLSSARGLFEVTLSVCLQKKDGEEERTYRRVTAHELRAFYETLLDRIEPYARWEKMRREEMIPTVRSISFPYASPREGQTEFAEAVFRAVRKKRCLFAEAPTGIGKTMSALYPAVKALGEGYCDRVFYLTAKANVRKEAYAAARLLFESGAKLRTVTLYAKEQMCLCERGSKSGGSSHCNPEDCPYARGYYDRADAAIFELLGKQNGFPRTTILDAARRYHICPYELSLDLSEYCEIIICDYNYVFDPAVYLRRYFSEEGERGKYVFLIDEAHNLPDRARDIYSATLEAKNFEAVYARVDPADTELEAALGGFLMTMHRLSRLCTENRTRSEDGSESGYYLNHTPLEKFGEEAAKFRLRLEGILRKDREHPLYEELNDLIRQVRKYLSVLECFDDKFLTYVQLLEGALSVEIYCLDPSSVIRAAAGRAVASVFFSATLTPLSYFADLTGCGKHAEMLELTSPYDPARFCVTVVPTVDTTMEGREKSYKKIATMIAATVSARAGNYIVYFPSYDYLGKVLAAFRAKYPSVTCIVQEKNMTQRAREAFLEAFPEDHGKLRIGFCVMGGGFSEGVDLPGSRLIGVVVVGVGIPGLSNERNFLRDYFEHKCERGYDYAYTFPGMTRVLQAAGRVIRTEEDKGVLVLIDARYAAEPYLHLYPSNWADVTAAGNAASLARRLQDFWAKK